eukprot:6182862-Pleurochrysis_carterae.AAC.1
MEGAEVDLIHRAKEQVREVPVTFMEYMVDYGIDTEQQTWGLIWKEFLKYAQQGDRGRAAEENACIDTQREHIRTRESHPTLYPGEVVGESGVGTVHKRRNIREFTGRAKANQQKREKKEENNRNKRIRLAEGANGTRKVSERPDPRPGGGEWEMPPHTEDIAARRLIGGQDSKGIHR